MIPQFLAHKRIGLAPRSMLRRSSRAALVSGSEDSAIIADRNASTATAYLLGHHL
jgi:hypothetical protein